MRTDAEIPSLTSPPPGDRAFQIARSHQPPESSDLSSRTVRPCLADHVLSIHEYERRRIGQELHDSAGQLLVSLQLSVARLGRSEEAHGRENLIGEIQDTVRKIDSEIRALAFLHQPAELSGQSLCEAVEALVRGFGKRTGIDTTFRCNGRRAVAKAVSIDALRVIQEALVNVHRHAHASHAKVVLSIHAEQIRFTISDDGIGMPAGACKNRGIGIQSMRHRVEMHGGKFRARRLRRGTSISATIPLEA
jgi:two-component system, NarL family, sensor kinase